MKIERPKDMARRIVGDTCAADDARVIYEEAIRARDAQVLAALGFALAHSDPFPLLHALAADLGGETAACSRCGDALGAEEIGGTCEAPSAPTLPGPTEHVDMALRFRYRDGCFTVPVGDQFAGTVSTPAYHRVHGLAVRIVYEHSAAEAEAAQDCAESWRSRMLGAREVECVGEVVT